MQAEVKFYDESMDFGFIKSAIFEEIRIKPCHFFDKTIQNHRLEFKILEQKNAVDIQLMNSI